MNEITQLQLNYMQSLVDSIQFEIDKGRRIEAVSVGYLQEKITKLQREIDLIK